MEKSRLTKTQIQEAEQLIEEMGEVLCAKAHATLDATVIESSEQIAWHQNAEVLLNIVDTQLYEPLARRALGLTDSSMSAMRSNFKKALEDFLEDLGYDYDVKSQFINTYVTTTVASLTDGINAFLKKRGKTSKLVDALGR